MRLTRTDLVRLLLLWLGGIDLRLTMLAVPPLIPLIHRELHLDEKSVGALVSGPVLLLAIAAVPGSLLIAKLGIRGALAVGLGAIAVFGVLPLAHGDWRWALGSWSVLVALSTIAIATAAPKRTSGVAAPSRWWPDWRQGQAIRIGVVMGMASAAYFGANAFIPDFLDQTGRHNLISPTLALLNGSQLLTAPAVALWPQLLTGRGGFVGSAGIMAIAQLGLVLTPGSGVLGWAFVLGFATALAFVVVLSLPPRVAPQGDVARMSAAIFTLQYATAFVVPLLAGALWDASGKALF